MRRIYVCLDATAKFTELRDVWLSDLDYDVSFEQLDFMPGGVRMLISVRGDSWPADDAFCYPAVRTFGEVTRSSPYSRQKPWEPPSQPATQPAIKDYQPDLLKEYVDMESALPQPNDTRPETIRIPIYEDPRMPQPDVQMPGRGKRARDEVEMDNARGMSWYQKVEDAMSRAPVAKVPRRTGRQAVELRRDIGPRPDGCTKEIWEELCSLHTGLGHPSNTAMQRMLTRHWCRPEVIEFARQIVCSVCIELSRPASKASASSSSEKCKAFRDVVAVGEFFVNSL